MAVSQREVAGTNAILGCSLLMVGGEFVKSTESTKNMDQMAAQFEKQMIEAKNSLRSEHDERFRSIESRVEQESVKNRDLIKSIAAEVSVTMEKEILIRIQDRMKTMDVIPEIENKMIERVKLEVITEIKGREVYVIEEVVKKVIQRVVAEPIPVPAPQPSKSNKK